MKEEYTIFKVADYSLARVIYALKVSGIKDFTVLTQDSDVCISINSHDLFMATHSKENHDDVQHAMDMDIVAHPFKPIFESNPYDYAIKTNIQQEEDK